MWSLALSATHTLPSPRGRTDLFVGEWAEFVIRTHSEKKMISHSRLLRNRGGDKPGFFVDETQKRIGRPRDLLWNNPKIPQHLRKATLLGVYTFSPAFVDLDNDGWPDLTIASDFGTTQILWNNQGTFKRRNNGACCDDQNGMGSTFSDVDNDGKFDWFVGGIHDDRPVDPLTPFGVSGNRLYRNEGVRAFSDLTDTAGVRKSYWSWGSAFLDYDNDGDEDLCVRHASRSSDPYLCFHSLPPRWFFDITGHISSLHLFFTPHL